MDHGEARPLAQPAGEGALARPARADYEDAAHAVIVACEAPLCWTFPG
jgi:hypothetical protein